MNAHTQATLSDFRSKGSWPAVSAAVCLAAGLALIVLGSLPLMSGNPDARLMFKHAWLTGFVFTLSPGLGALFFVMIQHVTGAKWSIVVRRIAEHMTMMIPIAFIMFIPVLLWMRDLYPWTHPQDYVKEAHELLTLQGKEAYLNPARFTWRAGIYFSVWIGLAALLRAKSLRQDDAGGHRLKLSMSRWSGPGILLFSLTITFAAFDWMMSLSPLWYSTIYGVYWFSGCALSFHATLALMAMRVSASGDVGKAITTEHFHDIGKLMFGFTIFWAYIAFSQLLLIWMANIPEETHYFFDRWNASPWRKLSYFMVFGHFVLPFLFLLPRTIKRFRPTLALAALWMLFIHWLDIFYLVMPAFSSEYVPTSISPLMLGFGMLLTALSFVFYLLQRSPLVPRRDPRLAASMAFENF